MYKKKQKQKHDDVDILCIKLLLRYTQQHHSFFSISIKNRTCVESKGLIFIYLNFIAT